MDRAQPLLRDGRQREDQHRGHGDRIGPGRRGAEAEAAQRGEQHAGHAERGAGPLPAAEALAQQRGGKGGDGQRHQVGDQRDAEQHLLAYAHRIVGLHDEALHWVKAPDLVLPEGAPVPFLSFDDNCFYRRWGLDLGQDGGRLFETVFECASAAGIVTAVLAGLGVVRRARRRRNPALDTLVAEIQAEISRSGTLQIAV